MTNDAPWQVLPTRRELWLAATLLLVLVAPLVVEHDSTPRGGSPRKPPSVTMAVPPTNDEIKTLLTNMPLAIAPSDAIALNAARPLDGTPTNFARPFFLPPTTAVDLNGTNAALNCLTQAIYYEAASESDIGERAVAQVVLNRMRSPIFPHTVCGDRRAHV